jgi:hypothetical protein
MLVLLSVRRVISPVFYPDSINPERYTAKGPVLARSENAMSGLSCQMSFVYHPSVM